MACRITVVIRGSVELAVIARFRNSSVEIEFAVAAGLVRLAVTSAAIAVVDVAIVAVFSGVHVTVAAAADVDAHGLVGCALLTLLAMQLELLARGGLALEAAGAAREARYDRRGHHDAKSTEPDPALLVASLHHTPPLQ
jgi:hypothetical protein